MKDRLGFAIFTVLPLFASIIDSRVCIGHFVQGEWPPHEMFHLLMGLAGLLTSLWAHFGSGSGSAKAWRALGVVYDRRCGGRRARRTDPQRHLRPTAA